MRFAYCYNFKTTKKNYENQRAKKDNGYFKKYIRYVPQP